MEEIARWPQTTEDAVPAVAEAVLTVLERAAATRTGAVVLTLQGDLGAGKTTFTQQLAQLLGVAETVTSPTFVILKQYQTTHATFSSLVHIDAYRIEDESELAVLGWEELCQRPGTLILLEWPSQVPNVLPDNRYTLTLDITGEERDVTLFYGN